MLGSVISMEGIVEAIKENVLSWGDCVEDAGRRNKTGEKRNTNKDHSTRKQTPK